MRRLYRLALEAYFAIRPLRLKELIVGTKAWEDYWARRKRGSDWHSKGHDWIEGYWESISHPHRQLLVEAVAKFKPKSILEIGCACGPNLYLLAKRFPEATIWGIDINRQAIDYGQERFYKAGMKNVWLCVGRADSLLFAENTFDVVFTDATLIYIGPDKIQDVMGRMLNIAKKGLVLVERHRHLGGCDSVYRDGLWQRDYVKLLHALSPTVGVSVSKIPNGIWPEWADGGAVIEAKL